MAKPIFLIGFPMDADNHAVFQVQNDLSQKLDGEYHVIAYKIPGIESIKFEVLNAINANDVQIEELILKANTFTDQILKDHAQNIQEIMEELKNNPQ